LNGEEYELQHKTVRDGKLFVNPLHLPEEEVLPSEEEVLFSHVL
jgi:hypothetical protein